MAHRGLNRSSILSGANARNYGVYAMQHDMAKMRKHNQLGDMNNAGEKQNGSTASKTSASQPIGLTSSIIPFRNTTVLSVVPSDNSGHGSTATRKPSLPVSRKNGDKHSKPSGLAAFVDDLYA
jgi:hypothetical protein